MIALLRRLMVSPSRNVDLGLAWLAAIVLQPLVPLGSSLGRPDLVPFTTACVVVVAALRARSLGDDPFPALTARAVPWARLADRAALVTSPVALLAVYDLAAERSEQVRALLARWLPLSTDPVPARWPELPVDLGWVALALGLAVALGTALGRRHDATPWSPPGGSDALHWLLRAGFVTGGAAAAGAVSAWSVGWSTWLAPAALLGVQFLTLGLLPDRLRVRWQRARAGRRDGGAWRPPRFRELLALSGPSAGLALLLFLHHVAISPPAFETAPVVALHVFAWAAVIWPLPVPVAVSCILHEIVPAGGSDPAASGALAAFERPPEGALRLEPLGVRRIRVVHHWVVPVRDPRIEDLDDPVRPLWPRPQPPLASHVLGDAAFEPDPASQLPQWTAITIRLQDQRDVVRLEQGNVQTRRLVVLRPFPGRSRRTAARTYRWDQEVPQDAIQVVDATTESLTLRDGDVLVLSTEGVARAYELEIGAPIAGWDALGGARTPQLEDYVAIG